MPKFIITILASEDFNCAVCVETAIVRVDTKDDYKLPHAFYCGTCITPNLKDWITLKVNEKRRY